MQNKPNFRKSQMNVNIYYINDYKNFMPLRAKKQTQFKPNQTQFKKSPNERKLNFNKGLQKK